MRTRNLAYFLSGALSFFGGSIAWYANSTDQSPKGRFIGSFAGGIMILIGSLSCCYLLCSSEEGSFSTSETQAILDKKTRKSKSSLNSVENNAFRLLKQSAPSEKDIAMLQFTNQTMVKLSSAPINLTVSYQCVLYLWRELIRYGREHPRNSCPVEEKLKTKILEVHEFLLRNYEAQMFTDLQKLILQEIPSEDYFTQLINFDLIILNSKLREDNNILRFIKEIFPEYLKKLESSQLLQNVQSTSLFY